MLNKKGWGLGEMLILSGILALFLIIAIYFIYNFYSGMEKDYKLNYYTNLEEKLKEQAQIYINEYYDESLTSDYVTITKDVLKAYSLAPDLIDLKDNTCEGYVRANKSRAIVDIKAYISCSDYETSGYESWRE